MRLPNLTLKVIGQAAIGIVLAATSSCLLASPEVDPEHAAARLLDNPNEATEKSVATGKALFDRYCQACHGADGKGAAAIGYLKPGPDLTDSAWDYGDSDGEIFDTIRYGVPPDYNMEAWVDRIGESETWDLVNFLRSLRSESSD